MNYGYGINQILFVIELEITEIVLVHCNLVINDYQHDSEPFIYLKDI